MRKLMLEDWYVPLSWLMFGNNKFVMQLTLNGCFSIDSIFEITYWLTTQYGKWFLMLFNRIMNERIEFALEIYVVFKSWKINLYFYVSKVARFLIQVTRITDHNPGTQNASKNGFKL